MLTKKQIKEFKEAGAGWYYDNTQDYREHDAGGVAFDIAKGMVTAKDPDRLDCAADYVYQGILDARKIDDVQGKISTMTVKEIARVVMSDWSPVHYTARPYVQAMLQIHVIHDKCGYDTGEEVVVKFLGNASHWRGETAKVVKTELRKRLASLRGGVK